MNSLIKKHNRIKNKKGFTLIELIVVIAILGILASVLVPQLSGFTEKARMAQVLTDAAAIATVADALYIENGTIPTQNEVKNMAGVNGDLTINTSTTAAIGTNRYVLFTYKIEDMGSVSRQQLADGSIVVK